MRNHHMASPSIQGPSGIDWDLRKKLVARLNQDLATLTDLALTYKQAHWNVLGSGFAQLHPVFDRFAAESRAYVDDLAERTVALGGTTRGTIQDVAERSILPAFPPEERQDVCLIAELARRVDATADEIRMAIGATSQDAVTQDLYIDIARSIEEQRWMLLAHLPLPRQHPKGLAE
jgi:starvation-inducible DNA-binding protein